MGRPAGTLEVTKDGQTFTANTGTMWTCRKGGVVLSSGLALQAWADDAPPLRHLRVNGVELSYSEQGTGAPVVFVHRAFYDLRIWEVQSQAVAQQYRFIADNQRYHGTAPWPDEGQHYAAATYAAGLAAFIHQLNAGLVQLVAH